jgi:ankyrin repeat protein
VPPRPHGRALHGRPAVPRDVQRIAILLALALALLAADLHDAVRSGNLEQVKQQIARGAGVNQPDSLGATPLHDAAWSGRLEIAASSRRALTSMPGMPREARGRLLTRS